MRPEEFYRATRAFLEGQDRRQLSTVAAAASSPQHPVAGCGCHPSTLAGCGCRTSLAGYDRGSLASLIPLL